jgi:hypothetical protein
MALRRGLPAVFQLFAVILKEKMSEFHLLFSWIGFLPWCFWSGILFDNGRKYRRIVLKSYSPCPVKQVWALDAR